MNEPTIPTQVDVNPMPRLGQARVVLYFALLGAGSGAIATALVFAVPGSWEFEAAPRLILSPASLTPGLVFGVIIGLALSLRRLASPLAYAGYILASTLSYLAAFLLASEVLLEHVDQIVVIGLIAGLFGSACLTGYSALRFVFLRRWVPCLLMLIAGCLLGGLLPMAVKTEGIFPAMAFFALWQAGYAAALATGLPERTGGAASG
jgi:uncharacterized membrane protein (UPF0136 family)